METPLLQQPTQQEQQHQHQPAQQDHQQQHAQQSSPESAQTSPGTLRPGWLDMLATEKRVCILSDVRDAIVNAGSLEESPALVALAVKSIDAVSAKVLADYVYENWDAVTQDTLSCCLNTCRCAFHSKSM
jgi:hypothetical protein